MFPYGQMHQRTQVLCMINVSRLENKYSCRMLSSDKLGFYYKRADIDLLWKSVHHPVSFICFWNERWFIDYVFIVELLTVCLKDQNDALHHFVYSIELIHHLTGFSWLTHTDWTSAQRAHFAYNSGQPAVCWCNTEAGTACVHRLATQTSHFTACLPMEKMAGYGYRRTRVLFH